MKLEDKVIVITGASSGLGRALAKEVASEGAKVALVARSESKLQELKKEIGENAEIFVCDIRELSQVKATVGSILATFTNIDILVNNAGIWTDDEIEKNHPEKRKEAFDTNALGNIQFTDEILPHFTAKNEGYIFNVISTSGVADIPAGDNRLWQTYGATKWAMSGFTKTLRDSLTDTKIKVTGFFPGAMNTNFFEKAGRNDNYQNQPWMMRVEDVVDVIIFSLTRPSDILMERIVLTKVMQ